MPELRELEGGTKVMVAMSGGVDSSVAALLLQEAGLEPVGVTMRYWVDPEAEERAAGEVQGCCSLEAVNDARSVADKLGIPHYVLNMRDAFYQAVVRYFTAEYLQGRTPNPCIVCNRRLKFHHLHRKALELGIRHIATGHYARIVHDRAAGRYRLLRGRDPEKDQSYGLYHLGQEQLSFALFPLGDYTKDEVREIAARRGLKTAEKAESQEICFIPDNDYRGFLHRQHPEACTPGDIVSTSGRKLGRHRGVAFYTIGQRKGLGIAASRPLYVVEIDPDQNLLIVGEKEETCSSGLVAEGVSYVSGTPPAVAPFNAGVKIRYRSPAVPATVYPREDDKRAEVRFQQRQGAVTPGQAAVFYREEEVLGGGIIEARTP